MPDIYDSRIDRTGKCLILWFLFCALLFIGAAMYNPVTGEEVKTVYIGEHLYKPKQSDQFMFGGVMLGFDNGRDVLSIVYFHVNQPCYESSGMTTIHIYIEKGSEFYLRDKAFTVLDYTDSSITIRG